MLPETKATVAWPHHKPTSQLFQTLLSDVPIDKVTLAWLLKRLHHRSFGMVMLLMGLMSMIPGLSVIVAMPLAALGCQMMMAREILSLPRFIAHRPISTHKVARLIKLAIPVMKALEKFIRPRWQIPFIATGRLVGFVVLLLAATLLVPIPLSNVIPGAMTMLVAFAYIEEDGILLCAALAASFGSLAITIVEVWATMGTALFLMRP